jgi:hypothetical protein
MYSLQGDHTRAHVASVTYTGQGVFMFVTRTRVSTGALHGTVEFVNSLETVYRTPLLLPFEFVTV